MSEPETTATVLVVDDDDAVRSMLSRALSADGFVVTAAADGDQARVILARGEPDLVVLDLSLGEEDGLDILAQLRRSSEIPVILLTGRGEDHERILGLKLGADDYLVKPFSPGELAARITSVLRRTNRSAPTGNRRLVFPDLCIDLTTREVEVRGAVVPMTAREFDLLAFFASAPRQVFGREQLLAQVWESSSDWQDSATVTEHVRRIRRKIEVDPDDPQWILTMRGVGYRFEP
jgi:DNA-binding response OmpR family regulator